ncbi:MAG: acetyl-CoA C-acyltransferase [Candidatus Dadabacteria bacterium]|nr:MAG: acetyl-CoA C-acyltransferase [Candidatus Dadabacteria bacterium]
MTRVAIVGYARTPIGAFLGELSSLPAPRLGAHAIRAAVDRAGIDPSLVQAAYVGNVLQAGQGQAPARQAVRYAGLPDTCRTVTIHKVCGSGMQAIIECAREILLGEADCVVAAGMESMSQSPHLLKGSRTGIRMGNGELIDSMIYDGLWDPYDDMHMGHCGELCAEKFNFTREDQDAFSIESVRRARAAQESGAFADEIAPIEIPQRKGDPVVIDSDEGVRKANPDKIPALRPAFKRDGGTITAANASSINDGASAIVLMSEEKAKEVGANVIAWVDSWAGAAIEPKWFTVAPVEAMRDNLKKAGKTVDDIDLFEVNEAFAVVTMAAMRELNLPHEKTNVRGGAVVLGHPIGCSGNRIVVTLMSALKERGGRWGQAGICIGGGEALSVIIEMAD